MKLLIGNRTIANSADGLTQYMRADGKPTLELKTSDVGIVGMRYTRNQSRGWGIAFRFAVIVGRQFTRYADAEAYALSHMAELAGGASGELKYQNYLGKTYGFAHAALTRIEVVSEIGINTEIRYSFACGEPIDKFATIVGIGGIGVKIGNKILTVRM